jgi:protein-L-isoaspartate(D-aspartate) O-methyltransferase
MSDSAARRINMINGHLRTNKVTDRRVTDAIAATPREKFVPKALRGVAYMDEDVNVSPGRYLMDPLVMARLLQAAEITADDVVLDIAGGTGYSTAVLARLAGTVVSVESNEERVKSVESHLAANEIDNAVVVQSDITAGYPDQAPYDVIFVNGAVARPVNELTAQLADGGRLVVVERPSTVGRAVLYLKRGEIVSRREIFDAMTPILSEFAAEPKFQF